MKKGIQDLYIMAKATPLRTRRGGGYCTGLTADAADHENALTNQSQQIKQHLQKSFKIGYRPFQNLVKISPSPQKPPEIHSWNSLGLSWPCLGPSWRQEKFENEKPDLGAPLGLHFGRVLALCWRYVGPSCAPRADRNHML